MRRRVHIRVPLLRRPPRLLPRNPFNASGRSIPMPGAFANPEDLGSTMPSGCPAVWLNADGRAVVEASLYALLDDAGREHVHAEMERMEREHAERPTFHEPPYSPTPTLIPITPAERLSHSAERVIASALDLVGCLAEFRDDLKAYGSHQEVPDDPQT